MESTALSYQSEGLVQAEVGAVVFLIVGVGVATLVLIFVGVLGGQVYNETEADIDAIGGSVTNEAVSLTNVGDTNATATSFVHDAIHDSTLVVSNTANGTLAGANYTINNVTGTITPSFNQTLYGGAWNASYTHGDPTMSGYVKDGITSGFKALKTTGSYLPILVLAVIIFIVLGLVMGFSGGIGGGRGYYGGAL